MKRNFKISKEQLESILPAVKQIAKEAGELAMEFRRAANFTVYTKPDNSKVTDADLALHDFIKTRLSEVLPGTTILSEEDETHPEIELDQPFWTVDPIDVTDSFIDGGRFYVHIALMDAAVPVLGVVDAPYRQTQISTIRDAKVRFEDTQQGIDEELSSRAEPKDNKPTLLGFKHYGFSKSFTSASHRLEEQGLEIDPSAQNTVISNDLPVLAQVAQGRADIYINHGYKESLKSGNGYSWDYAPYWLFLKNTGGALIDLNTGTEATFENPTENMDAMVAFSNKDYARKFFPAL